MQTDPTYQRFLEYRARIYERLDVIRRSVDEWLQTHLEKVPEMSDLAMLEGLHEERKTILGEYLTAEDEFIAYMLSTRPQR